MSADRTPSGRADEALVELRHGARRALLAPHVGGAIAAFFDAREPNEGGAVHWLRPATVDALAARNPLGMASFPLVPYCNRIRDARFTFDGALVDLSGDGNAFPHALHGNGWRRPWRVDAVSEASARLTLSHVPSQEPAHHWPFAFEAAQDIALDAQSLNVTMSLRNLSDRPMPFGLGHHPYFPRTGHTVVRTRVGSMWHTTPEPLPTRAGPHPCIDALASREGMSADAFDLDNNFTGWSRETSVAWPREHRSVTLRAEAPFDFTVIYAPSSFGSLLCVEPVSNVADWVNLDVDASLKGGGVLAAGESVSARFWLTPEVE
ncbi:aldose 1-epimerase (plasmid) [Caballeronia sp. M1242]|nr:aldose 1-epimerase [Caballeronia sp. M1242]